jgi:DNA invertase Pin-like site-specific DNA recombinase
MGSKGDRTVKEPIARRMYAENNSLTEISRKLDISVTTLRRWKEESRVPGEKLDGWDKARGQKFNLASQVREMVIEQFEYVNDQDPADRDSKMLDALSKMFSMFERMESREAEIRKKALEEAANAVEETARQQGMSEKDAQFWREQVLGVH